MNNDYSIVGLYDHNITSYKKARQALIEDDIAALLHATGTGKTYNALQLAYDNKDKKIIYVVPSNAIIEHIKRIIEDNPNLDLERDFPNLEFRTYQSFVNMSDNELTNLEVDMLILDEFHHLGAPVWGDRINRVIETHQGLKVFGMSAYSIRDRGTAYERDMANPEGNELFSNKVVSRYDLCDAMIDGVIPKPIYKSAYTNLTEIYQEVEEKVLTGKVTDEEMKEYMEILEAVKKRIHEAPTIADVVKKNVKRNGKYIYFCPPASQDGVNDIETIKEEAKRWFLEMGLAEEDIVFYQTTSEMGNEGKQNRDAFYNDLDLEGRNSSNKLRVMFAINQYNEGTHAPNIDGVIMGRGTTSDIVYFEQLGRGLSVRGDTKKKFEEYEKYSVEELLGMCKQRDIIVSENTPKEEIIEKLLAPVIIDLVNNYDFIKELENNLRERVKLISSSQGLGEKRVIRIRDVSFDIDVVNQDLFGMLKDLNDRVTMSWEKMYEYAKIYYEEHGDLEVPKSFKTNDGKNCDDNGKINLGTWIFNQRKITFPESERGILLSQIGMRFESKINSLPWEEMYKYAKIYYEEHGDLEVPQRFKTSDGKTHDEDGKINLGQWIKGQRQNTSPESEKGILLLKIGMQFEKIREEHWEKMYKYAKIYYEEYGNLEVPKSFKTNDGKTYDENGMIHLGEWINRQRQNTLPESERGILLSKIGMRFEKTSDVYWEKMYKYAKKYYEEYGDLEVPAQFKTNDGKTYDENGEINLGIWIANQRKRIKKESEKGTLLSQIGMRFENKKTTLSFEEMYEYAKKYYEEYGDLEVPHSFKTTDGKTYDENGEINLGMWIATRRKDTSPESEKGILLSQIGMRFENKHLSWEEKYEYAMAYYNAHGNLKIPAKFKTNDGVNYDKNGFLNLGMWIVTQRQSISPESEKGILLSQIGMIWDVKKNKEQIEIICANNNINMNVNKKELEHISVQELQSKISLLQENSVPITDSSGKLHEIFSMSNINMQTIYNISLEDLINKYYLSNDEKRGK